jgi:eukaryotic-like serine/threonine-protein kinase
MTLKQWQRIEELFHSALERGGGERAAFLDHACDKDTDLRRQIEELLASFEEAGDFIEQAPLAGALSSIADESSKERTDEGASLIGQRVGHYEIQSLLGAGGMGEVYLAHDLKLARQIAIKILPAPFTEDEAQVERFEREARAASALNHPNIITIHEIGRDSDTHFIATEFVDGQTLREKIASGKLSLKQAVTIGHQVADALQAAHAGGIVHRDIKPENVMVRPDGLVKVLDFGLAKPVARESAPGRSHGLKAVTMQTDPGMLMGTICYLSPEQVLRQEIDHRTDIFSLGVVLYEMVTRARPFTGESAAAICEAILRESPLIARADVPHGLKRIINRALEKDRAARYQTAREMRNDLQRLAGEANRTGPGLFSGWQDRAALATSAITILTAITILVAIVILAAMLAARLRHKPSPEAPAFSTGLVRRITDNAGQEIFPSLSPDGQSIVYASRASGNWDIYLKKIGEAQSVNLTSDSPVYDMEPAFSPDGTQIAFYSSREGRGIFLMDTSGRNLKKVSADGHNPAWSPDGREIALAEDRVFDYEGRNTNNSRLFAVNIATGERRVITGSDAVQPNWSPRGQRIAYWGLQKGGQRDIWTVRAAGGEPVAVTDDKEVDWNPVWSRDGKYLYFLSDRGGSMNVWRAPIDELSGKVTGEIEPATLPSANSQHLNFSADGQTIVYVEMNRRENLYQVSFDPLTASISGQPVQITQGIRRYSHIDLAPDEKSLVFVSAAEAQEDIFVISREGAQLKQLTNDSAQDRNPRWSPGDQRIAFLSDRSGKYEIWKVNEDGSGLEQLTNFAAADVINPVWSPDGTRLLYKARDINTFIIETDKPLAHRTPQPLPGQPVTNFLPWSWSADGKLLAGWINRLERPSGGVAVYSFDLSRYEKLTDFGRSPIWLNDNRRLIFSDLGKMYLLDVKTGSKSELHSVEPSGFGSFVLSRDNRRLYYSLVSTEADLWLLPLLGQ